MSAMITNGHSQDKQCLLYPVMRPKSRDGRGTHFGGTRKARDRPPALALARWGLFFGGLGTVVTFEPAEVTAV